MIGHADRSPEVLCHSPFALSPVTSNTQMSMNWVRGVTFMTTALPCKQKETSFVIQCLHTYAVGCLAFLKVLERICEKGLLNPPITVGNTEFMHMLICFFNHSSSIQYILDTFNQALSSTPKTQKQKL